MTWQIRHQGSPRSISGLTLEEIVEGLRDGVWETTDEVKGPQDAQWKAIENHPQLADLAQELTESPRAPEEESHVDMNALIDVCLVLLIFFILTTSHATAVQKVVPLPVTVDTKSGIPKYTAQQVQKFMIRVQAHADDKGKPVIRVEKKVVDVIRPDQTLDVDRLVELLRPHVRSETTKTEMVLDAQGVSWGLVISLQDAAKGAGVRTVHHLHKSARKPG